MTTWNVPCRIISSLCDSADETIQLLFLACTYVGQGSTFEKKCSNAIAKDRGSTRTTRLYTTCFTKIVYAIWKKRNNKIFNGRTVASSQVVKDVLFQVACSCTEDDRKLLLY